MIWPYVAVQLLNFAAEHACLVAVGTPTIIITSRENAWCVKTDLFSFWSTQAVGQPQWVPVQIQKVLNLHQAKWCSPRQVHDTPSHSQWPNRTVFLVHQTGFEDQCGKRKDTSSVAVQLPTDVPKQATSHYWSITQFSLLAEEPAESTNVKQKVTCSDETSKAEGCPWSQSMRQWVVGATTRHGSELQTRTQLDWCDQGGASGTTILLGLDQKLTGFQSGM